MPRKQCVLPILMLLLATFSCPALATQNVVLCIKLVGGNLLLDYLYGDLVIRMYCLSDACMTKKKQVYKRYFRGAFFTKKRLLEGTVSLVKRIICLGCVKWFQYLLSEGPLTFEDPGIFQKICWKPLLWKSFKQFYWKPLVQSRNGFWKPLASV